MLPNIAALLNVEIPVILNPAPTVTIPTKDALPSFDMVATPTPIFNFVPSKVRSALSSSSPEEPAITTLLFVKSPIAAVSAERESMFAVPSIYKSLNSAPEEPKSLVPSASGSKLPLTVRPAPTLAPAPT